MKGTMVVLLAATALMTFLGCSTITIESAKAGRNIGTIQDVYVVLDLGTKTPMFNESVRDYFQTALQAANVNAVINLLSGLEVDDDFVAKEVAEKGLRHVLVVQLSEAVGIAGGWGGSVQQTGGVYDLSLYLVETGSRIWRAKLELSGGSYAFAYSETDAEQFVNKVIEALAMDGLI